MKAPGVLGGRGSRWLSALAFALFACVGPATATQQIADAVVLDGQSHVLQAEPFGVLLDQPEHWQTFRKLLESGAGGCSANWRGYRGYWSIEGERLYLTRLEANACAKAPAEIALQDYFPGQRAPILADWFSGPLLILLTQDDGQTPGGSSSRELQYLLLEVNAGAVVSRRLLDPQQLEAWRETRRAAANAAN